MKNYLLLGGALFCATLTFAQTFKVKVNTSKEPIAEGKYEASMQSLSDYQCPEWFRNAKFGIWAHWGPQCQPEYGDWYARGMYIQGDGKYKYQIDAKGHPSEYGFKDWIPDWKADKWNPDYLVKLYKDAGAKYFFAMANHHDNFDMYDSKYQPWNSVNMGPHKDIIAGWASAAKKYGLPLGLSVHASHAWCWYETSRGADSHGALKGVRYDGWLTKADGKGKWWEGYDPQDLYEQRHKLSKNNRHWDWDENEVTTPDQAYCDKIYNRTVDLINKYDPDMLYFDDTYLPLWPVSDAGLAITAHLYNKSMAEHKGRNESVVFGKVLNEEMKKTIVADVERGAPDKIQDLPWQTCTCIGEWHYNKWAYLNNHYKSPQQVVRMLVDVVSKNGNLLLSIPLKGNGSIDPTELKIVEQIGVWMKMNGESIYGTRPWLTCGEGPSIEAANPINAQGFNEGRIKWCEKDVRYNQKGKVVYATLLGMPQGQVELKCMGRKAQLGKRVRKVELLGSTQKLVWKQQADKLIIEAAGIQACLDTPVFKITY